MYSMVAVFTLKYTSTHVQQTSVLFEFFQLVSILSLLVSSSSVISLLVLPSSAVTSLCTISAAQSNINHNPTSVPSAQDQHISLIAHDGIVAVCVCVCVVGVFMCIWGCIVTGESICTEVVFSSQDKLQ